MFQDSILAVCKALLDIVIMVFINIQKGLLSISDKHREYFVGNRLQGDRSKIFHLRWITLLINKNGDSHPPHLGCVQRLPTICNDVVQNCSKNRTFFQRYYAYLVQGTGRRTGPSLLDYRCNLSVRGRSLFQGSSGRRERWKQGGDFEEAFT